MRQKSVRNADVIAKQITFRQAQLRKVDLSQVCKRNSPLLDFDRGIIDVGGNDGRSFACRTLWHACDIPDGDGFSALRGHGGLLLGVFRYVVTPTRFVGAAVTAAIVGLIAITIYLVVERAIADHLSVVVCLQQLLQWDASNAYGRSAFDGGWGMAGIGLAMDFVVSLCWAILFAALYAFSPTIRNDVIISGLFFGVAVMVVMIYGIVPLGHATQLRSTPSHVINVFVAHTLFFGLPLALTVRAVAA